MWNVRLICDFDGYLLLLWLSCECEVDVMKMVVLLLLAMFVGEFEWKYFDYKITCTRASVDSSRGMVLKTFIDFES